MYSVYMIFIGALAGLVINLVINRLPQKLYTQWHKECEEYLETEIKTAPKKIANISIKTQFLLLLLTVVATYFLYQHFKLLPSIMWFSLIFTWGLIILIGIDFKHQLLPDEITLSLLWLGLIANSTSTFVSPVSAIWGAAAGYLSLYLIAKSFQIICKREGMGHGDFKLLACIGAWQGFALLPLTVLLASLLGLIAGIIITLKHRSREIPYAFGPYIAIGGWITLFYGKQLNQLLFGYL